MNGASPREPLGGPRITVFAKLFAINLLLVLSLAALILFISFRITRGHYLKNLSEELNTLGTVLARDIEPMLMADRDEELARAVRKMGETAHVRLTLVGPAGTVLADSQHDPSALDNHASRPEIADAMKGFSGKSLRYSTTVREKMLYVALPIGSAGTIRGVLRLSLYLKDIEVLLGTLRGNIIFMVSLVLVMALAAAGLLARSFSRPIVALARASREVAEGKLDVAVSYRGQDEIRDLSDSFAFMVARIKKLLGEVTLQKDYLDRIVSSIREGLAVADRGGNIALSNESFRRIFGGPPGRSGAPAGLDPALKSLVEKCRSARAGGEIDCRQGESVFHVRGSFVEQDASVILIVFDVTASRRLEESRRDFSIAASHELRTPLTAIRGFAEMLEEKASGDARRHLEIIRKNAERLIRIADRLLELARLDDAVGLPEAEEIDLQALAETVADRFRAAAEKAGLSLRIDAAPGLSVVPGDRLLLEQALANLLDNAVKHTPGGGITIAIRPAGELVALAVSDTGVGIPAEHLERVFERFYVVDKSRARALGGAGLGLAIVARTAALHRGSVRAESSPGRGTTVTLSLPSRRA